MQTFGIVLILTGWAAMALGMAYNEVAADTRVLCAVYGFLALPGGGFLAGLSAATKVKETV